jgi:hypothetical protein
MKSINKHPHKTSKFDGVLIGDEHIGPEKVEYLCSCCNRSLIKLTDKNNQSESWFCRNCSIEFNSDDEQVSHKQKLSIPYQDNEPAVASIGVVPDVSIHHETTLKGWLRCIGKERYYPIHLISGVLGKDKMTRDNKGNIQRIETANNCRALIRFFLFVSLLPLLNTKILSCHPQQ